MKISTHVSCYSSIFVILIIAHTCSCDTPSETERISTPQEKFVTASNEFALDLHRTLTFNSIRNLFMSPVSLFSALGVLYKGARGKTAQELRGMLRFAETGLSDEDIDLSFNHFLTNVLNSSKDYIMKSANIFLVDRKLQLLPEYTLQTQNLYKSIYVTGINFRRDASQLVKVINDWISSQTNGKIPALLDNLDPNTVIAIFNAVYFKGLWEIQFDVKNTKPGRFNNYGLKSMSKSVPMMNMSDQLLYTSSPDCQIVELPYKGDNVSMMIFLPDRQNGLSALERNLTVQQILAFRRKMRRTRVNLSLPKFSMESTVDLKQPLTSMGLGGVFLDNADFSGMVQRGGVRVSKMVQKTVVEVTEEGTEAAAVTGVFIVPLSISWPRDVKVDHPFLFAIIETKTNLILFMGRVVNL
ncbi:serpin B4 [Caerostris extrusa]|uniref:Serpin B4 n=1 Tax=Caerostris extrusa TaxID=172846 RepID=A0AAV4QCI7_CAEEX|nr:serpin B4 [Caerostris extrusa]